MPARRRIARDDMRFAREVARLGGGVGALPPFLVHHELIAGSLVRVLPRTTLAEAPAFVVRPNRVHVPRR